MIGDARLLTFKLGPHRAAVAADVVLRVAGADASTPTLTSVLHLDDTADDELVRLDLLSSSGRHAILVGGPIRLVDADASNLLPLPAGAAVEGALGVLFDDSEAVLVLDSRAVVRALGSIDNTEEMDD